MMKLPSTARTVIGSGGRIFDPSHLPGLAAWYSADFGVLTQVTSAAKVASTSSEYLSGQYLDIGYGGSWTVAFWVRPDILSASNHVFSSIDNLSVTHGVWARVTNTTDDGSGYFRVFDTGGISKNVSLPSGTFAAGSWYFILLEFNQPSSLFSVRINNGVASTTSTTATITTGGTLQFGRLQSAYANATLGLAGYWKRLLTSDERTFLYNNGFGRLYIDLPADLKTDLVSYWNLTEASGTRNDAHGTNNLTDNNTVTTAPGPYATPATDGQTVRRWLDRSGNGRHLEQATLLSQPTFKAAGTTGVPCLRGDGLTSSMSTVFPATNDLTTIWATKRVTGATGSKQLWDLGGGARPYAFYTGPAISGGGGAVLTTTGQLQHVVAIRHSTTAGRQVITPNFTVSALGSNGSGTLSPLRIFSGDAQNFDNSDLSEFVQYTRLLADSELAKVFAHLVRRWGNSLNP